MIRYQDEGGFISTSVYHPVSRDSAQISKKLAVIIYPINRTNEQIPQMNTD